MSGDGILPATEEVDFWSNMIRFNCSVSYALTCDTTITVACSGLVGCEIMKCIRNDIEGEYKFALLDKPRPFVVAVASTIASQTGPTCRGIRNPGPK